MKLTVVIPAYNEAGTIREVIARVRASPLEKEIVVVDDCSTDGTREVLRSLAEPASFRARQFIDPIKLRDQLTPAPHRWHRELWRVANFELWMRVFGLA